MLDDDENWPIFSLTENLTNSYVDKNNLLSYYSNEETNNPIGMDNFHSKQKHKLHNQRTCHTP
jgi:hypothetical protein